MRENTLLNLLDTYQAVMADLESQIQPLQAEFSGQMQCQKGCSACCVDGFKIRYIEAVNLLQGFATASPDLAHAILNNLKKTSASCPLLVDGSCALYQHRPALCRAFGLIIKLKNETATCNLNFQNPPPEMDLKQLDIEPFYNAFDTLSVELWQQTKKPDAPDDVPLLSIREFLGLSLENFL